MNVAAPSTSTESERTSPLLSLTDLCGVNLVADTSSGAVALAPSLELRDADKLNKRLTLDALTAFYAEHEPSKGARADGRI